jgi:hypothetical protein
MQLQRLVRQMGYLVLAVGIVMVGLGTRASAEENADTVAAGVLDGKVFIGEIGGKGKAHGDKDEFHFQAGKFRSTACDPYGFTDGNYSTVMQGGTIAFEAQTTSPTDGTMVWEGTVHGDTIEGTATWHKTGGKTPEEMWFKGDLTS